MTRFFQVLKQWSLPIIWMAMIFFVSHQPSSAIPSYGTWDLLVKKGGHVLAYFILAVLLSRAGLRLEWALFVAVAYAISDEYHQTFVPGRNGTVVDVLIDSLGVMIGLRLLRWLARRRAGRRWAQIDMAGQQLSRDA